MELIAFTIRHDWPVLLPIILCSVLALGVGIERRYFYWRNQRDLAKFIEEMGPHLERHDFRSAFHISEKTGGLLGQVAADALRMLASKRQNFDLQYDIISTLATRELERGLSILGTIATVSPYLGLFGTVVRILLTFGEMSAQTQSGGGDTSSIMFGIGSALIATAFGLGVAITAVALNNYFHAIVNRWEDDFQVLKLMFLTVADKPQHIEPAAAQRPRRAEV